MGQVKIMPCQCSTTKSNKLTQIQFSVRIWLTGMVNLSHRHALTFLPCKIFATSIKLVHILI